MRVADYVIDYIYKHGTDTIFTLAGGGAMFLNDAIVTNGKIKYVCNHHEQASAMAAEAYAKASGKMGAVIVTSGPGSTNAITGLLEAYQNSIPVIFISSQAKKSQMTGFAKTPRLRQIGIQEVDIIPIIKPLTKYAAAIKDAADIKHEMEKAYHLATIGRPGPVWLDIPSDIAATNISDVKTHHSYEKRTEGVPKKTTSSEIDMVLGLLKKSKKSLIIAGGGVRLAGAVLEFNSLVKKLKIPVVVPEMGLDLMEFDNPYYLGHGGTKGQRNANIVIQNADLLLILGSRLAVSFTGHEYDKFAPGATKIVVDIDPLEHEKQTVAIDHLIESDVLDFISKLDKKIKNMKLSFNENWLENCRYMKRKYSDYFPSPPKKSDITMYEAVSMISKFSRPGDFFTFDAGITAYVCGQALKLKKGQRAIIPGATLTMGYNLPAIIGIWAAHPKADIICITGDGSLQMNIHELATVVHHKIPAKIFVINNGGYLAIRTTQRNFFQGRYIGEGQKSGVTFPVTERIAKAYGIKFFKIKNKSQLDKTISKVLDFKGSAICEVMTPYWQDIITVSSKKMPDGKMVSQPIDNMAPFLSEEEMEKIRLMLS